MVRDRGHKELYTHPSLSSSTIFFWFPMKKAFQEKDWLSFGSLSILGPIMIGLGGGVPLLGQLDSHAHPWEENHDWQLSVGVNGWNGVRRRVDFSEAGTGDEKD